MSNDKLIIVKEIQKINEQQIENRKKVLELSKKLEKDVENEKIRMEIKKLEVENIGLSKRDKQLIREL